MDLRGRDFLRTGDFSTEELELILKRASQMKLAHKKSQPSHQYLAGKSIAMLFQKPSTRTRLSFDVGINQLGGHPIYLNWGDLQLGRGETINDTGKIFGCYVDGIVARVYRHADLESLAASSPVPVINALSDEFHPCQALSDCFTIIEKKGRLDGLKIAFVGDGGCNVSQSLAEAVLQLGGSMVIASPKRYSPREELISELRKLAKGGAALQITEDPVEAVRDADVIYTDVWVSMGTESEAEDRLRELHPYQVNKELLAISAPESIVMHCLPAHRGEEITNEVIDGPRSVVWEQAENRLHVQKSIMSFVL
ncbi:MAG: ornithine carbamoyltransferase [Candidatus Methanosuratincola sp.]|jgi:ornithine carbamoyltransferase|nr:ornithine carbamoyltransferase [Candidatus Methanosuratincola sp.]